MVLTDSSSKRSKSEQGILCLTTKFFILILSYLELVRTPSELVTCYQHIP